MASIEIGGLKCQMNLMAFLTDPLNLALIAVAVFVGFKLWQVLGLRTGFERMPPIPLIKTAPRSTDLELKPLPGKPVWQGYAPEDSPLAKTLMEIAAKDTSFQTDAFIAESKLAHEHIQDAFAKGD